MHPPLYMKPRIYYMCYIALITHTPHIPSHSNTTSQFPRTHSHGPGYGIRIDLFPIPISTLPEVTPPVQPSPGGRLLDHPSRHVARYFVHPRARSLGPTLLREVVGIDPSHQRLPRNILSSHRVGWQVVGVEPEVVLKGTDMQ